MEITSLSDYSLDELCEFAADSAARTKAINQLSDKWVEIIAAGCSKNGNFSLASRLISPKGTTKVEAKTKTENSKAEAEVSASYKSDDKKTKVEVKAKVDSEGNVSTEAGVSHEW
jgi:hypothetical protein